MSLAKKHDYDWHKERMSRVGGSDVATLCRSDAFKSPARIWATKIGHIYPQEENEFIRRGEEMEPYAIRLWGLARSRNGRIVIPDCQRKNLLCIHPRYDFMGVLLDAVSRDLRFACEVKTLSEKNHQRFLDGEPVFDRILCQVQYQMMVSGRRSMDLLLFSGRKGVESLILHIKEDKEFHEELERRVIKFWDMVQNLEMPSRKDFPEIDVPQNIVERICFC